MFAERSASLEYQRPARFNDQLTVTESVTERRRASLVYEQRVSRLEDEKVPLSSPTIKVACLDAESLAPRPIPEKIMRVSPEVV